MYVVMSGQHQIGVILALTAGAVAALGSTSAKLATTAFRVETLCTGIVERLNGYDDRTAKLMCESISLGLRIFCFACTFLFNALMWTFYTKSLQYCTSTVEATITNTGANFLFTAVLGLLLFGESLSLLWWCGSCLILAGLILIHKGSLETKAKLEPKVE